MSYVYDFNYQVSIMSDIVSLFTPLPSKHGPIIGHMELISINYKKSRPRQIPHIHLAFISIHR